MYRSLGLCISIENDFAKACGEHSLVAAVATYMAKPVSKYLFAAEEVLKRIGRPMSSRELVSKAFELGLLKSTGRTPHKTMNARISEDILSNISSVFTRTRVGVFALRDWEDNDIFYSKRRRINPIDEDILVIPLNDFKYILKNFSLQGGSFYNIPPEELLKLTLPIKRLEVEEDNNFVQIVSLFNVMLGSRLLTYTRTSRLPEKRLHHARSINFGGHMVSADRAPLFETFFPEEMPVVFSRELFEELRFVRPPNEIRYIGSLYSTVDDFSRRHVGVAFQVTAADDDIESAEPGFHTNVKFENIEQIASSEEEFDEWTGLVLGRLGLR